MPSLAWLLFLGFLAIGTVNASVAESAQETQTSKKKPNFIVMLADDLGYNDIGAFGSVLIRTPNLDRMAREGMKLTQFYSEPLCTPSRGAMLTGRLPVRTGLYTHFQYPVDELFRVFYPSSVGCLSYNETTIADALKPAGYRSGIIGKWHVGHNPDRLCGPMDQGFDYFYGLPYSHEEGYPGPFPESVIWPPVPLYRNRDIIEQPVILETITQRMTSEAVQFMEDAVDKDTPFFLHIAYEEPHVPLFSNPDFAGTSRRGAFGDAVEQMDASIGAVLETVERLGIADNTMILFTSDNGAWTNPSSGVPGATGVPEEGGSNAPFREGKGSTWEGGIRVPGILWWPGTIDASSVTLEPLTFMDILPTLVELAGAQDYIPEDVVIDGKSFAPLLDTSIRTMEGPVHDFIFIWREQNLMAVRYGPYKAHFATRAGFKVEAPTTYDPPLLFHIEYDPAEAYPLDSTTPENKAILDLIVAAAENHVASMQFGESQYQQQDWGLVPCCGSKFDREQFRKYIRDGQWDLALWQALGCVCPSTDTQTPYKLVPPSRKSKTPPSRPATNVTASNTATGSVHSADSHSHPHRQPPSSSPSGQHAVGHPITHHRPGHHGHEHVHGPANPLSHLADVESSILSS